MNVLNAVKGFLIGIALVIPGLSGSLFAIVVGLYEGIIDAVGSFHKNVKANIKFLIPIAIGCVVGILSSTKAVLWVCENYQLQSYMFFIGLVLGALPLILRKMAGVPFKPAYILLIALSFAAVFITATMGDSAEKNYIAIETLGGLGDFLALLFAGAFSVSIMMIPGISGSVMLMVIGQYGTVYNAVGMSLDFLVYLIQGDFEAAGQSFMTIALILPFLIGALIGLVFIAKMLSFFLKRWEALVYYCVMGLVLGAVAILAVEAGGAEIIADIGGNLGKIAIGIVFIVVGCVCTIFLDQPGPNKKQRAK